MTTGDATLPSLGQSFIIGIWVATVLYGMNCVMYALAMFILLRGEEIPPARRMLVMMSTVLFILCTAHVVASLRQLLEAFIYAPRNVSDCSKVYWVDNTNPMAILKNLLYDTLLFFQYCILIWRLYVIFMNDWRVIVLPIILLVGCMGSFYAASIVLTSPNVALQDPVMTHLSEVALVLDVILNVSVTVAIAVRLWWIDRKMASLTMIRTSQYLTSISVLIETGTIFVVNTILMAVFFELNRPVDLALTNITSQSAALAPLLIVVQVGLAGRHRIPLLASYRSSNIVLPPLDEAVSRSGDSTGSTLDVSPNELPMSSATS